MQKSLGKHDVLIYSTHNEGKSVIAERFVQWNLSKVDTIGAKKFVRFRQMSAL